MVRRVDDQAVVVRVREVDRADRGVGRRGGRRRRRTGGNPTGDQRHRHRPEDPLPARASKGSSGSGGATAVRRQRGRRAGRSAREVLKDGVPRDRGRRGCLARCLKRVGMLFGATSRRLDREQARDEGYRVVGRERQAELTARPRDPKNRPHAADACHDRVREQRQDGVVAGSPDDRRPDALLPAQRRRRQRRGADRARARVRDLRRVHDADGAAAGCPRGQRGARPTGLRTQPASGPHPLHPPAGRDPAGGHRRPRLRPGRAGRQLDGLPDQPRGRPRGPRAGGWCRARVARRWNPQPAARPARWASWPRTASARPRG